VEPQAYRELREHEDRHWWYRSLRALVQQRLRRDCDVLDAGCGTGGMLARLGPAATGVDISGHAVDRARERGLTRVARASVCALPFSDGSFDAVLALDVLYHRAVTSEARALSEIARVLRPGGSVFIHTAAHPWLARAHDRAVHGARRFTRPGLAALARDAGLEVVELAYRNALALPAAAVLTLLCRVRPRGAASASHSDLRPLPAWLNGLLLRLSRVENALLASVPPPAGLSLWCVCRKP
jgi:SAM-dependent methyltransferase